jgi:peroxiredoxin
MNRSPSPLPSRRAGSLLLLAGLLLSCAALAACGDDGLPAVGPQEGTGHPMVGRPAPDFVGEPPVGGWLPLRNLKDKPVAILFYRPGAPFTRELAAAFKGFRSDPAMAPTVFLGIANVAMDDIKRFNAETGDALPTLRDPGTIGRDYGVGDQPTVVLLDSRRFVRFRLDGFAGRHFRERVAAVAEALRRLPVVEAPVAEALPIEYTGHPRAPVFAGRDLDGHPFDSAAWKGQPLVLIFFDQECPHCQRDLPRLGPVLRELRGRGVRALGVSSRDLRGEMRAFLKTHDVDFPVLIDPDRAVFGRFQSTRTPDLFVIDREGLIRFRERGDRADRADLLRLQLQIVLGEDPKTIAAALPRGRYLGDGVCSACHEREFQDWLLTPHSIAWDSLAKGDKWKDPECVKCHVTGMGDPGGFVAPESTLHMVNVQCEVCHGMGGGHPEGKTLDVDALSKVCTTCHMGKFVLNFSLAEALPLVAHQDHPDLDRLFRYSDEQRQRLDQINKRRMEKFKSGVAHVGADACKPCHAKEYAQWSRTPHAAAFATLLRQGRNTDPACQPCHTTGFGLRRGYGDPLSTTSLTGVQCEVCHGPGEDHVNSTPALKKETIYGITDQCSFCIIQGVCATCHDAKNDPHFAIEAALPKVKH